MTERDHALEIILNLARRDLGPISQILGEISSLTEKGEGVGEGRGWGRGKGIRGGGGGNCVGGGGH